jgi:hypothetical protein
MSMQSHPANGYVVDAAEYKPFVPADKVNAFDEALRAPDSEENQEKVVGIIVAICKENGWPAPDDFFVLDVDDFSDDLSQEKLYACFGQTSLFRLVPLPETEQMQPSIKPQYARWTNWG